MRPFFIGRFQPFHFGHYNVVRWLVEQYGNLVLAIGSAQAGLEPDNPFTVGERIEMVYRSLADLHGRVKICSVPDTEGKPSIWHAYVRQWCPPFDVAFTGDQYTAHCLKMGGIEVREPPSFSRDIYTGTYIRKLMAEDSPEWKSRVPVPVVEFIYEIDGVSRVRNLLNKRREKNHI